MKQLQDLFSTSNYKHKSNQVEERELKEQQLILIIEDEEVNRRIICNLLKTSYKLIAAENGRDGLELCQQYGTQIAAILLDLVMPVMNGYDFMEAISHTQWNTIPILVMTESSDRETEKKALLAGAVDFIKKPYDAMIIDMRLKNAIARSKMAIFEEVKHLCEFDTLTGLYNRRKLFEETRKMIQSMPEQSFVFVRMDIDHFALYNSSFGEAEGDRLLCYMADMFRRCANSYKTATYGRISADIFCLCTPYHGGREEIEENIAYAQQLMNEYSEDYLLKISAGACMVNANDANIEEIYLRASLGAQRCKNQYEKIIDFYDESFRKQVNLELSISNDMQAALEQEQFVVYLQPKYSVRTERICGAEALVRWNHPEKGLISPGVFIPVFERNGFISKVDYYMWEHTCQLLSKWKNSGYELKPVSVNVSRISLYNPNLDQLLIGLTEKYGIETSLLELEITESAYMSSPDVMQELVKRLHQAGFSILMDDFGSDYSSLNTLKDMELDIIKIDMGFIPKDAEVQKGEIILACIIKMAKWLGISVIAEGVETRRQRDFLEGAGCDVIQGFYYSKPISIEEYEQKYVIKGDHKSEELESKDFYDYEDCDSTILVIDDSELTCELLKTYFEKRYHVVCCFSAEDGMVYLKKHPDVVKLIIVDNMMPGMSGIDFLKYCQYSNELNAIPKVMITSCDTVKDQLAAFQAGAYDFITKPLTKEIVKARIKHIMEMTYHYTSYDKIEQDYYEKSERDAVTGLLCHAAFRELTAQIISTFSMDSMAIFLIDINICKANQKETPQIDKKELCRTCALELKKIFRKSDVLGYINENEFAVLLCGVPERKTVVRKAAEVMKQLEFLANRRYEAALSIDIGIAFTDPQDNVDIILAKADQALSEAKSEARDCFIVYGEGVPAIINDEKPIVLICGGDQQIYREVALAYGEEAAFAYAKNYDCGKQLLEQYKDRIKVICMDLNTTIEQQSNEFYQLLLTFGAGRKIPLFALYQEGRLDQLKEAIDLQIYDVIPVPIQIDVVQSRISYAMASILQ